MIFAEKCEKLEILLEVLCRKAPSISLVSSQFDFGLSYSLSTSAFRSSRMEPF